MGKNDIIAKVSLATALPRTTCEQVIDAFRDEIKNALIAGEIIMIKDFMRVEVSKRSERNARNPLTGEIDHFPEVKSVKCKFSKKIKDAVNNKESS